MKIAITIDVEPDYKTQKYTEMKSGLLNAKKLFDKYKIKPTLFVTCDCIEKHPEFFRKLKKAGWEISLHGYRHLRFDTMNYKEKDNQIKKALYCFKKYLNIKLSGLRAPQFSSEPELLKVIDKYGFKYDSSKVQFPLSQLIFFRNKFKLYWNQIFFNQYIRRNNLNLIEIPVSAFGLPISMFVLRKLPYGLFLTLASLSLAFRSDNALIFLSHSYEFNNSNLEKLEKFIIDNKNAEFVNMEDLV